MRLAPNSPCLCHSGAKAKRCCRPLHGGQATPSPEALMRSRFAAFAAGLAEYIIATTHPAGDAYESDRAAWRASIEQFSASTEFQGLEIQGFGAQGDEGWVQFHATLRQGSRDASFTERSRFVRLDGRWTYHSGTILGAP